MDNKREGLPRGTILENGDSSYEIGDVFAYGGSSIIYRAVKDGRERVVLKEIYPARENGNFARNVNGQVEPSQMEMEDRPCDKSDVKTMIDTWKDCKLLNRLHDQLKKEEQIGHDVRNNSFLVCNLKELRGLHLQGNSTILKGFAEMDSMELSGRTLSEYFEDLSQEYKGAIPLEISLKIIKEIGNTLRKIHKAGFIYCDLSKGNIFLLNDTLTAVFIDFGSALPKEKEDSSVWTSAFIPSTWGHRAPEIAMEDNKKEGLREISEASDVYALLTFFYEFVAGKPFAEPFEFTKTKLTSLRMVSWKRLRKIGVVNPVEGLIINYILERGLLRNQKERIGSVHELLKLIAQVELIHRKESDLYASLKFSRIWHYEKTDRVLYSFFSQARPDLQSLNRALEQLERELLGEFHLDEAAYEYEWLDRWIHNMDSKDVTPHMEVMLAYVGLAIHNHYGECQKALNCFKTIEKYAAEMEISKYLDARLRVAETYANCFDYKKAFSLMKMNEKLLSARKVCYKEMANAIKKGSYDMAKTIEYGKTASALARYASFLGKWRTADKYFTLAIDEFQFDKANERRSRNAAIQMAISSMDKKRIEKYALMEWNVENLERKVLDILSEPEIHGQKLYDLHAYFKGIMFLDKENRESRENKKSQKSQERRESREKQKSQKSQLSVTFWDALEQLSKDEKVCDRKKHPWELIYRHAAILLAEHRGKVDDCVKKLFFLSRAVKSASCEFLDSLDSVSTLPFDTVLVLHMVTLLCEYKMEFTFANPKEQENWIAILERDMEKMAEYLWRYKCKIVEKEEWQVTNTWEERYELLMRCCRYEYE